MFCLTRDDSIKSIKADLLTTFMTHQYFPEAVTKKLSDGHILMKGRFL